MNTCIPEAPNEHHSGTTTAPPAFDNCSIHHPANGYRECATSEARQGTNKAPLEHRSSTGSAY